MIVSKKAEKSNSIPSNLRHKPIYAIEQYSPIDGFYKNNTDVYALSIGKAQWDAEKTIPSVKVWRKVGPENKKHWSRQSEETTITRALDMAMLIISVLDKHYNGKPFSTRHSLYGSLEISDMHAESSVIKEFNDFLDDNKADINEHVKLLQEVLESYKVE